MSRGIGDTVRVSLTVPNEAKAAEVAAGNQILDDIEHGRFRSVPEFGKGLNIISCPSCSRVENEAFVNLALQVKDITQYAARHRITIAVMGCRVNGPGETDDADLGLWCGPNLVNLKRGENRSARTDTTKSSTVCARNSTGRWASMRAPTRACARSATRHSPSRPSSSNSSFLVELFLVVVGALVRAVEPAVAGHTLPDHLVAAVRALSHEPPPFCATFEEPARSRAAEIHPHPQPLGKITRTGSAFNEDICAHAET